MSELFVTATLLGQIARWGFGVAGMTIVGLTPAAAGGFYSPYQSATAIGTAFAGATARSDDAGFFFYNPATISALDGAQSWTDARAFLPSVRIEPSDVRSPLGAAITGDGTSGNILRNALAAGGVTVVPVAPGLMLGIGTSAPFATDVETETNWAGRYHLLRSYMVGLNATAAVSWQASHWLAVSAGAQAQWMENRFTNIAVIPQGQGVPAVAQAYLKGTGWATGAVAGIVLTPSANTRIGVSWRSALTHRIEGTAGANLSGIAVEQVRYDLELPQTVSVGVEQRLTPRLRVFAEWQRAEWSRFKGFDISFASGRPNERRPVEWQNTWLGALGVGYRVLPGTELTAGVNYDTGASRNGSGSTLSPDANKLLVGIGIIHDEPGIGRVSFSYGHLFIDPAAVKADSPSSGLLNGSLKGQIDMFGIGYTLKW